MSSDTEEGFFIVSSAEVRWSLGKCAPKEVFNASVLVRNDNAARGIPIEQFPVEKNLIEWKERKARPEHLDPLISRLSPTVRAFISIRWRLKIIVLNPNRDKVRCLNVNKKAHCPFTHNTHTKSLPPRTASCHLIHLTAKILSWPSLDLIHYLSLTETISQNALRQTCFSPLDVRGGRGPPN